jgi:hypothetical protein
MPMTYNEYLIALETELVSITDEKEEKIRLIKEKIVDTIKRAWDKFCEFIQNCSNTLKGVLIKFKSKGGKKIAIKKEDINKIEGSIELFKEHSEEYDLIIKELKKTKRDKIASVFISILATVTAAATAGAIFVQKTGIENFTISDETKMNILDLNHSTFDLGRLMSKNIRQVSNNILFDEEIDFDEMLDNFDETIDKTENIMDQGYNIMDRGSEELMKSLKNNLKFLCIFLSTGSVANFITKILTNSKETKEKIKILKNIVRKENLTNEELQQINRLLALQKNITTVQLNAILNAKYII